MRKLSISVLALAALLLTQSCVGLGGGDASEEEFYGYFLRDAKAMESMGLPVYWLGREFKVEGLMFRGPHGAEFGADVEEAGGLQLTYVAELDGGNVPFQLIVRSRAAWAQAEQRVRDPGVPGVTRRVVAVGDRQGELISIPSGTRPVNTLWLVLDLGDVVVLGQALAGGPVYPGGPDYNPFTNDPDLLVQVMQDLRPYPQ